MMDDFFAPRDFTGRSAYHSMGPFPFFICTLHILHSLHCFHFSSFGFQLFFVNHFFSVLLSNFLFSKRLKIGDRQTNKQTNKQIQSGRPVKVRLTTRTPISSQKMRTKIARVDVAPALTAGLRMSRLRVCRRQQPRK